MAVKLPPLPAILTANALLEGHVVYWGEGGWAPGLAGAFVAQDEAGAATLQAALDANQASGEVVDAELAPVTLDEAGRIIPTHYRERIRALGPTVRRDFGPQAQGEHDHVSL